MKTELILKSDVLDILFENRNKAYGAYYLRKFYNNRLIKSLGMMLTAVVILSAFTFIPNRKAAVTAEGIETVYASIPQPKEPIKAPEKPKEPAPAKQNAASVVYTNNPVIVPSSTPVDVLPPINDSVLISDQAQKGVPGNTAVVTEPGNTGDGGGNGKGAEPVIEKPVDVNIPTGNPDVMPEYPGGMNALKKFLERNLTNPRDMDAEEVVSVRMRFVVGYDGKLKSFETVQDGGEEFNKEVIRVLKKMPEWIPGKTRGQNVSVYYTIPVKFIASER